MVPKARNATKAPAIPTASDGQFSRRKDSNFLSQGNAIITYAFILARI
jgi:hypothetical protein